MFAYVWPIALVALSNVVYQLCLKSVSSDIDPFAALTVTYAVAAGVSAVLFFALNRGGNLIREYAHINWASFALAFGIVGLEAGYVYAYKAGWSVSIAPIVQTCIATVALIFISLLVYRDNLSVSKIAGIVICLVGLWFINK